MSIPEPQIPPGEPVGVPVLGVGAEARGDERAGVSASLLEICRAMSGPLGLSEVLDTILRLTLREMRAQQGSILLIDEGDDRLRMLAALGLPDAMVRKGYLERKGSIAEWVIRRGQPLILNDAPREGEFSTLGDRRSIVSAVCMPLRVQGRTIGVLNLNRTDAESPLFTESELEPLDVMATQAAQCIENARLHEACLQNERLAAIGQTVAGVAHCIKNVLTHMSGGVALVGMARDQQNWEMLSQAVRLLTQSNTRVTALVMDMLDYSKEREPELSACDLREMIGEVVDGTLREAGARDCQVYVGIGAGAESVQADEHQLFRCLLNLVQNGIDASARGGIVSIHTERATDKGALRRLKRAGEAALVIRVSDQGAGIPPDIYPHLFEPFFSTKGNHGTGLGLAVTRKIIEEHGGMIELASKPWEPATFAIYLPA
jgi:signal transduction histidine kinase